MFQPLFFWIQLNDQIWSISEKSIFSSFNPYFSGFSLMTAISFLPTALLACFNPYFSGFSLMPESFCMQWCSGCEFQSLFFWIQLNAKGKLLDPDKFETSFNPYFSGFSLMLLFPIITPDFQESFNPYFSGFSLMLLDFIVEKIRVTVSILIFLDLA